jgi:hypothetical protein
MIGIYGLKTLTQSVYENTSEYVCAKSDETANLPHIGGDLLTDLNGYTHPRTINTMTPLLEFSKEFAEDIF